MVSSLFPPFLWGAMNALKNLIFSEVNKNEIERYNATDIIQS